jgi:hypothetical protein
MVPIAQFAVILLLAAIPALLMAALARQAPAPRSRRGGDPVAIGLRRRGG